VDGQSPKMKWTNHFKDDIPGIQPGIAGDSPTVE